MSCVTSTQTTMKAQSSPAWNTPRLSSSAPNSVQKLLEPKFLTLVKPNPHPQHPHKMKTILISAFVIFFPLIATTLAFRSTVRRELEVLWKNR